MKSERFCNITSWNNRKRIALHSVAAILFMYAMILVCLLLNFEWWSYYDWACIAVSLLYLVFLSSIGLSTQGVSIFQDEYQRLQDYINYSEAPYFANSFRSYCAPIRIGDYVALSNERYLKLDRHAIFKGKDIDLNGLYSMDVCLMDGNKKVYEVKGDDYVFSRLMNEIYEKVKDDGLDIEAIYNQFGDLKWKKSEGFRKKSKVRQYYKIFKVTWLILQFVVAVLPVLYMLYTLKTTRQ